MTRVVARVVAAPTPSLSARVVGRTPLFYARGADPGLDRPAHVRAGSALARLGPSTLAVVQDDANFLAVIDGAGAAAAPVVVHDVALPAYDGVRQFGDARGNKKAKLDLEACLALDDGRLLVAFGSGSTRARERVVLIDDPRDVSARVTVVEAPELYDAMRAQALFCGSELNVEGAALAGDDVILLQRGNGAACGGLEPSDATARIDRRSLVAYLRGDAPCPPVRDVVTWELGASGGTRLTFTDGVATHGRWTAFLACAEASPDATRDGPVSGVVIGRLDDRAREAEHAPILDERGEPLLDKAEGIALDDRNAGRAWLVVDRDDPARPAELLELALGDRWQT
ncbi:MAG: hypothetical protein JWP87_2326 [Labilithrix sp.]|nr:hypothetical protein [Labilithrix sp.]